MSVSELVPDVERLTLREHQHSPAEEQWCDALEALATAEDEGKWPNTVHAPWVPFIGRRIADRVFRMMGTLGEAVFSILFAWFICSMLSGKLVI